MREDFMNREEENKCFAFTVQDTKLLLFLYNTTCFFFYWMFFNSDFNTAFTFAMLASLLGLFVITMNDIFQMQAKSEIERRREEIQVQEKLKAEYQKVYRIKRREDLIKRSAHYQAENKKNKICNVDSPPQQNSTSQSSLKSIHFSYLDAF